MTQVKCPICDTAMNFRPEVNGPTFLFAAFVANELTWAVGLVSVTNCKAMIILKTFMKKMKANKVPFFFRLLQFS